MTKKSKTTVRRSGAYVIRGETHPSRPVVKVNSQPGAPSHADEQLARTVFKKKRG